ncbi:ABC transporter ATP-binding protein [Microbacterium sp. KSW4-16]|uniref:ABC transporter ATP-binding protein n=1 Tax=Microbacterium aurugineum TaxID=2851642 RepID=UPI0020BD866B|nr:ABC transporter ATP-binding protein [Microbacterium aurugineum]MCK8468762.1 ABC transporter ATP-binding protein [Microbacterium aurugineum]
MSAFVEARGLTVEHGRGARVRAAVLDVDLSIAPGEAFGLIGPSGSGKTTLALALARYLPTGARLRAHTLRVGGIDVTGLDAAGLRRLRRTHIGFVPQDPGRALNPTAAVGAQIAESHRLAGSDRSSAQRRAVASLDEVGLPDPEELARRYPHELSGGQQQRAMIAMALATRPGLLILDEPTTGLDPVVRAGVLDLLCRLRAERGFATLLIGHDVPLVSSVCDRVGVLDGGRLSETPGPLRDPQRGLPAVRVPVSGVRGSESGDGAVSEDDRPAVLVAAGIGAVRGHRTIIAGVDLRVARGETLAVIGQTGSGKTTLGRIIAGLDTHDGEVSIDAPGATRPVQLVFQDPGSSLNPQRTVRQTLGRAIRLRRGDTTVEQLAARTGLPSELLDRRPGQLSGGQQQRVAIARAFAGRAPVVVCDEPTSALDAETQTVVLDLLCTLQDRDGTGYLFISHDLAVVRRMAHRVAVLHGGRIVEVGPTAAVLDAPAHPSTRALVAASLSHLPSAGGTP